MPLLAGGPVSARRWRGLRSTSGEPQTGRSSSTGHAETMSACSTKSAVATALTANLDVPIPPVASGWRWLVVILVGLVSSFVG